MKFKDAVAPFKEFISSLIYYVTDNTFAITCLIQALLPMVAMLVGFKLTNENIVAGVAILVVVQFVVSYIKKFMVHAGKGDEVPVPRKRFTIVDKYGEVSVQVDRSQELILYVCDLENYLERKGKL